MQIVGIASLILFLVTGVAALIKSQRDIHTTMAEVRTEYPRVPRISADDLFAWINATNRIQPQLLDIRTVDEFEVSHLPRARQVSPNVSATAVITSLDTNRATVLYCTIGHRSSALGERLLDAGFTNFLILDGSIFNWANEGHPLVSNGKPANKVHPYNASVGGLLKAEQRGGLQRHFDFNVSKIPPLVLVKIGSALGLFAVLIVWESLSPYFDWFRNRVRTRIRHGWRNIALGILNNILVGVCFIQLWWLAANWSEAKRVGLLHKLDPPTWVHVILVLIVLDAWTYCWHRLNHAVPFLWRFHRTHHSELFLDVTSASRFHLGEIALSSLLRLPLILVVGIEFGQIVIYETILFALVQFHHANIRLSPEVDRFLQWIVVTPNMHRVHHSREFVETDSNFSSIFSFWDRLFRTWREREPEAIQFGLSDFDDPNQHSIVGLLKTPLK